MLISGQLIETQPLPPNHPAFDHVLDIVDHLPKGVMVGCLRPAPSCPQVVELCAVLYQPRESSLGFLVAMLGYRWIGNRQALAWWYGDEPGDHIGQLLEVSDYQHVY